MKENLITALNLTEEELFTSLGKITYKSTTNLNSITLSDEDYSKKGKIWFTKRLDIIKQKVCSNETILFVLNKEKVLDNVHLAIAIASIFEHVFEPAHVTIISALIIKNGIHRLCKSHQTHDSFK
ncbi:MAG: hypothetical protein U0Y08_03730 [Bacteroidia bacterium]